MFNDHRPGKPCVTDLACSENFCVLKLESFCAGQQIGLQTFVSLYLAPQIPYALELALVGTRSVKKFVKLSIEFALFFRGDCFSKQTMNKFDSGERLIVHAFDSVIDRVTLKQLA
jgi:hypothetical protein